MAKLINVPFMDDYDTRRVAPDRPYEARRTEQNCKADRVASEEYRCLRCEGTGEVFQHGDMHRSEGIIPCDDCRGLGKLCERTHAFLKRLGYRVSASPLGEQSE